MDPENTAPDSAPEVSTENAFTNAVENQQPAQEQAPAPEPTPAPEQTPPPEPEVNETLQGLMSQAEQMGIKLGDGQFASEADLARAALQQLHQNQPYYNFASTLAPHADKLQDLVLGTEQTGTSNAAQPPAPPQEEEWSVSGYLAEKYGGPTQTEAQSKAIEQGLVVQNAQQQWEPAPGYEVIAMKTAQELNVLDNHRRGWWNDLLNGNPYETFYSALEEPIMRAVQQKIDSVFDTRQQQAQQVNAVGKFESENASWLFKDGNPEADFTEQGAAFRDTFQELKEAFGGDDAKALQYAMKMVGPKEPAAPPEQPAPAQPPQAQPPQDPPPQQQSFLASAAQRAQHNPPVSQSPEQPMMMSDDEHSTLFSRAMAKGRK